ncbi:MAG: quinolinate synthase NadA [Acidobacteriota bacterium]|nr:quinolinate synthase NadA [Acidobacteriota bacterium]MDH3785944.1 quinolinate synthase NadA [Acidobacteriota bacterium]
MIDSIYENLKRRLSDVMPDFELRMKAEVAAEIEVLKRERNAVILAHNYMEPALFHSVPDIRGDSLELSRRAAAVEQDVIVFCGVRFMAETAKILSPTKTVLLPSAAGGCSLASSITAADVRRIREQFPDIPVVCYVNTYADVKAEVDVCCTSGNAAEVVKSLDSDQVIFLPDEFLARNVAIETGKTILLPAKDGSFEVVSEDSRPDLIGWHGRCEVHEKFTVEDIENVRKQFPDTMILAHPECSPEVVAASDYSGSTTAMIKAVEESSAGRYLLLTECAMGDNIAGANPDKEMLRMCSVRCPHMNEITLEETRDALLYDRYKIEVPDDIRVRAEVSIRKMLAVPPSVATSGPECPTKQMS